MSKLLPCPCGSTDIGGSDLESAWCNNCGLTFDIQGYTFVDTPDGMPKAHAAWNRHAKLFIDLRTPTSEASYKLALERIKAISNKASGNIDHVTYEAMCEINEIIETVLG